MNPLAELQVDARHVLAAARMSASPVAGTSTDGGADAVGGARLPVALATFAAEHLGHVDILVNNAGVTHLPAELDTVSEADFDRVPAVNAKSVCLTARHFMPTMKARSRGAILDVASTAGVGPRPRLARCNASKGRMITGVALEIDGGRCI